MPGDQYALSNGYGKTTQKMTEQEKALLRYQFVCSRLADIQGTVVRTTGTWSYETNLLSVRFERLKTTIGQGLISALTPVISVINALLSKLQVLANAFANLMGRLFGFQSGVNGVTDASGGISSGYDAIADSANGAASAAEKAKEKLGELSIDQFNKLNLQDDSSSSGGGSGAGGSFSMQEVPDVSGEIDKKFSEINFPVEKFQPLFDALTRLKDSFGKLVDVLKDGLKWVFDNVLVPLGEWVMTEATPIIIEILADAIDILRVALEAFQPILDWCWDNFLEPIANFVADAFIATLEGIHFALSKIGEWMEDNQGTVSTMEGLVLSFFGAWNITKLFGFIQMSGGLKAAFDGIAHSIKGATVAKLVDKLETMHIIGLYAVDFVVATGKSIASLGKQAIAFMTSASAKYADKLATMAMTAVTVIWNGVCGIASTVTAAFGAAIGFLTSPIGLVILAIGALIAVGVLLYKNWDTIRQYAQIAFDKVRSIIGGAIDFAKNVIAVFIEYSRMKLQFMVQIFVAAFTMVSDHVRNIIDTVRGIISGIIDFITGIFTGNWQKAWDGIAKIFTSIWDGMKNSIKITVNFIIDVINSMLRSACNVINKFVDLLNGFSFDIPEWAGGGKFGISIKRFETPQIPRLATGAYFEPHTPTLAMVGEGNDSEFVAPEKKLREAVGSEIEVRMSKLESLMMELISETKKNRPIDRPINLDGKAITKTVNRENRKDETRRGK